MKQVVIALTALIFAAACTSNQQPAAQASESNETSNEVVTNDTISEEMKQNLLRDIDIMNVEEKKILDQLGLDNV